MENRRLLLAAFLSALILIVWNILFPPVPVNRTNVDGAGNEGTVIDGVATNGTATGAGDSVAGNSVTGDSGAGLPNSTAGGIASDDGSVSPGTDSEQFVEESEGVELDFGAPVEASVEKDVVLETESIRATFSNRGAVLVSLQSKVDFTGTGDSLELIRDRGNDLFPYALIVGGTRSHRLNQALFSSERITGDDGLEEIVFRYQGDRGTGEKRYSITEDGFIKSTFSIAGNRDWSVIMGPGIANPTAKEAGDRFAQRGVGYKQNGEIELVDAGDLEEDLNLSSFGLAWVSLEDKFFLNAILPLDGVGGVSIRPLKQRFENIPDAPRFLPASVEIDSDLVFREQMLLIATAGDQMGLLTFFGAKRYDQLVEMPHRLQETVRWGFLGVLAKPIYYGLQAVYERVPNYGWAIVIITFIIRLILLPLTYKSQKSMVKMQELNPKMQAIRNKYKSKMKDKQGRPNLEAQRQMNEEVMGLYKSEGVNPAAGCLPLLFQMPIFFALYKVIWTAVELRNAPWIGWIQDLSVPDPFWILPILMTISSFAMQKMMPQAPDPMQRRIMQIMPLGFGIFAIAFPSGLVLYWFTNNLLTMAQQAFLQKTRVASEAKA